MQLRNFHMVIQIIFNMKLHISEAKLADRIG